MCVAKCKDLLYYGPPPYPEGGISGFRQANARASTNFAEHVCFALTPAAARGGLPDTNFFDPRRRPEPVKWHDASLIDTEPIENSLRRIAGDGVAFNAGAASEPLITHGDGWVESEANETNMSHALGLSASCANASVCPDQDPASTASDSRSAWPMTSGTTCSRAATS